MCLTIGNNFKSPVHLPDEHNCFSDCTLLVSILTVEMKPTRNLVLYCTHDGNTHMFCQGFVTVLCLHTMPDFIVATGDDLNFSFPSK